MNNILKNIIVLGVGIIIEFLACNIFFTYVSEMTEEKAKANELLTLTKEVINEKNYYSVSPNNMLFIRETLKYNVYSCENSMFSVVLTNNNNEKYCFDFIDTKYGTYYLGINGYVYTQQNNIGSGSFTIENIWTPNYSLYQNTYDYFDYNSMCDNIFYNLKSEMNSSEVYAINSFPWNKSIQGNLVLVIHGNEAIITYAIQTPEGFRLDRTNYFLLKSSNEDLIDKYKHNAIGFSIS